MGQLSVLKFTQPQRGTVQLVEGSKLQYNASAEGGDFMDWFTYWIKDSKGAASNGATVNINCK
jgi:hypothetical protein